MRMRSAFVYLILHSFQVFHASNVSKILIKSSEESLASTSTTIATTISTVKEVIIIENGQCRLVTGQPVVPWKPCRPVIQCIRLRKISSSYCDLKPILHCPRDQPYCCSWNKNDKGICRGEREIDDGCCSNVHFSLICCLNGKCDAQCSFGPRGPIGPRQWF
ncbi:hypothetical protein CHUAL_011351 [Chamberlinius hualienensis]